jgi:hypothetical protein
MSADTDGWEVVGKAHQHQSAPRLTIYANGNAYVNTAADERYLDGAEAVRVLVDREASKLALDPTDEQDPNGYSVTREEDSYGGAVRVVGGLERLGVDIDALEGTSFLPLEEQGEIAVADVSSLLDDQTATDTRTGDRAMDGTTSDADDTEASQNDEAEDDEAEGVACRYPDCDRVFGGENGRNIHEGQKHGGMWEGSEDHGDTEVPDPEDVPSHETVRDCASNVNTVQELADLLDVDTPEARFLARDADAYGNLQDRPPRPGVDR